MKDDWSDEAFAERWDSTASLEGNPTRFEQLDILASVIADNYRAGDLILDLGCGSGQVAELVLERCPEAHVVGVDSSAPMLAMAKKRLALHSGRFQPIEKDIAALELSDLPTGTYGIVFSSQVLHELDTERRLAVMENMHRLLAPGGLFIIVDRLSIEFDALAPAYRGVYDRLQSLAPVKSGRSYEEYAQYTAAKQDRPATLEEMISLLHKAGFAPAVLQLHFDRAVFAGLKA